MDSYHVIFLSMDDSYRYTQIKITLKDDDNITLSTIVGVYYYKAMTFGIKMLVLPTNGP